MTEKHKNRKMRRKLSWLAFFTRCKAKLPPEDQHERRCTCVRVQVEHNVPEYVAKFLNLHHLKSRVSVYMEREVRDTLQMVVKRIGDKDLTVCGYIDNILRAHMEAHREEINAISRDHADIL